MKILFCIYKLDFADHIALSYLSAIAKQLNHTSYFCSLDSNDLVAAVDKIKPDIVAYSVNVTGYKTVVEANQKAIKMHNYISIMGGPHPTYSPETFSDSGMDAYCVGEGEYPFMDFLEKVENGESFDDVANLITKNKKNPVRPLIRNLDELPPANRDLVLSNSYLKNTPKKTFYVSRGCPFQCTYCSNNFYRQLYKGKGPAVRRFSVERIITEIEDVKRKYVMHFIKFGDDCFAIGADEWLEEFAEKYPERIGVKFNCFLRLDTIDNHLLKLLKKAGCFSVHLSVDSTSRHVRENILKRRMRSENIIEKLRMVSDYGINTWVNYMLAAPESTLQDDLDTIELNKAGKVTYPSYSTTVPMKGTELYNYCVKRGIIDISTHKNDMNGCTERSTLNCFTEKEKDVRFNIFLLGALISKLPYPLVNIAIFLIKIIPPNRFFRKIRGYLYGYYIANKIFLLPGVKKSDTEKMNIWTKIMD